MTERKIKSAMNQVVIRTSDWDPSSFSLTGASFGTLTLSVSFLALPHYVSHTVPELVFTSMRRQ